MKKLLILVVLFVSCESKKKEAEIISNEQRYNEEKEFVISLLEYQSDIISIISLKNNIQYTKGLEIIKDFEKKTYEKSNTKLDYENIIENISISHGIDKAIVASLIYDYMIYERNLN